MAICLACMSAVTFPADLHATTALPGEDVNAEQIANEARVVSRQDDTVWYQAVAWVWSKHHEFHRALTRELRELHGKDAVGWALVLMSFLYGVLHAAGPGHGKAVLTTYLLTHRHRLNCGIAMGTVAALLQGLTAMVLVDSLAGLAGWLPQETETAALWAGRVSFGLLTIVGLYVFARAAATLADGVRQWRHDARDLHHDHAGHAHGEGCGRAAVRCWC